MNDPAINEFSHDAVMTILSFYFFIKHLKPCYLKPCLEGKLLPLLLYRPGIISRNVVLAYEYVSSEKGI